MTSTLDGLRPDTRNANRGTVRSRALLEDSLRRYGAGRSILADKHGNVIKHTEEARRRMSEYARKIGRRPNPKTPEQIAAIAQLNRGRTHTEEARTKISRGRQGMRFTPEHRAKLSERKQAIYAASTRVQDSISRSYARITDGQVLEVLSLAQAGTISQREIGLRYGIPASTVSEIKSGKRYKHVKRP